MMESYGVDVLVEDVNGTTPLHRIIREGKWNVLQWLIQTNRIDCDYTDKWGRSLMHIAASSSSDYTTRKESGTRTGSGLDILNWLIDNDGFAYQVSSHDTNGKTPLHVASSVHAAAVLIQRAGADIHARTKNTGATPLHSALCTQCSQEMIQWLVVYGGADVNARDNHGRTPLHVAIDIEDVKATEWLIQHGGADWTIRDDDGRSPLDAALLDCDDSMLCWGYHTPIVEILQQELLERYLEIQTLARKGAFSCPMRKPSMIGLIS